MPSTATGVGPFLEGQGHHIGRSPSWPAPPSPQQATAPEARRAQLCHLPAAISTASSRSTTAIAGVRRPTVIVPSPSWPCCFAPQQTTAPEARRAQACDQPAATSSASLHVPDTQLAHAQVCPHLPQFEGSVAPFVSQPTEAVQSRYEPVHDIGLAS